ncbi:MAG: TetR/AcrR family transcriptional regulator [Kibdelosporangium sp.]
MQVDHRKGPRRRGEVLEEAIMRAAVAELGEVGYAGVSMERIASRARTSKAALYRRWPDRAHLIVDAYLRFVLTEIEIPDTGSLRADVISLLRQVAAMATSPVLQMLYGLLVDAGQNGELRKAIKEQVAMIKPRLMADILARAEQRGEVRPNLTERQQMLPMDLLRNELIRLDSHVTDEAIAEIVDEIFLPLVLA